MKIDYIDLSGSNQHKKHVHRVFGLKVKTWVTILVILGLVFIVGVPLFLSHFYQKKLNSYTIGYKVYAQTAERETEVIPTLADAKTRTAMISIIKRIWRKDWKIGVAISRCESGLRPDAVNRYNRNGSTDAGLFQINSVHGWSERDLISPVANVGVAYSLYREQGTNPWVSSQRCWEGEI